MDQKFFSVPFANSGDKIEIPDALDPSGFINFTSGYPVGYQLNRATDPAAKSIERQKMNWLFYAFTQALGQYQKFGVPEFITTDNNNGSAFAYAKNAVVRYNNAGTWITRRSTIDNNTTLPTSSSWVDYDPLGLIADEAAAKAGISNTTLMSPLRVKQVVDSTSSGVPIGFMGMSASSIAEDGWLLCDGAEISRTTYAALFNKIGTVSGPGDGTTTFNLPDMRGVVPRGLDNGRNIDPGREIGSYQQDMVGPHTHGVNDPGHDHFYRTGAATTTSNLVGSAASYKANLGVDGNIKGIVLLGATNISIKNSTDKETRMKNVAFPIFIKYK